MNYTSIILFFSLFFSNYIFGQTAFIKGNVTEDEQNNAVEFPNIVLKGKTFHKATTDKNGNFELLNIPYGDYYLIIQEEGFFEYSKFIKVRVDNDSILMGNITIEKVKLDKITQDNIPTVSVSDEQSNDAGTAVVSSLLNASRDPFISASAFNWSGARFRNRGYDNDDNVLFVNGAPMNNLERGEASFSDISGLNDVLRAKDNVYGLESNTFTFGDIGTSTSIDAVAAAQRKGLRVSYALTNRSYRHRLMATYSTGLVKNNWAFTISGSKRYALEGEIPGSFYDSWALFASGSKKFGNKHMLSLTAFVVNTLRSVNSDATQYFYDLAQTNYYNPSWGMQGDQIRNARMRKDFLPSYILTYTSKPSEKSELTIAAAYQMGSNKRSSIDWFNAPNPAPDFYRNQPNNIEDPNQRANYIAYVMANPNALQMNWDRFYDVNRNQKQTVFDVNGIPGNNFTGNWSKYTLSYATNKINDFGINALYNNQLNDFCALTGGFIFQRSITTNYKEMLDLLGGDYFANINQFQLGKTDNDSLLIQNDADNPNRLIKPGDEYGYKYSSNIMKLSPFVQSEFKFNKVDFFVALKYTYLEMFREGFYRNGGFLNTSLGKSGDLEFRNYAAKGGVTYKLNGKNYFYVNALYETRAPYFTDIFISPRTRNLIVNDPKNIIINSFEGGYLLRDANWKARISAFYTTTTDEIFTRMFFNDETNQLGTYIISGLNKTYKGIELGFEGKLPYGLRFNFAASIGDYIFSNNPTAYFTNDNDTNQTAPETIYFKDLHLATGPQNAGSVGLTYNSKQFWTAGFNLNYFDKIYVDPSPQRRTSRAVDLVNYQSELYYKILRQEHLPSAFTLDLNFRKSFYLNKTYKLKNKVYIDLSASVNNVLDYTDFRISGREQLRFDDQKNDPEKFPNKYTYMLGRTYFITLTLRM